MQAEQSDERGHGDQALRACDRLIAIDPLREDWQRLALTLTARHRGCDQAMANAKALIALLRRELDAAPEPITAALIENIKRGAIAPASQMRSPKPIVVVPGSDGDHGDGVTPVPSAQRAVDAPPMADAIFQPDPDPGVPDWRSMVTYTWSLAALVGIVALAILVGRFWLLAPRQSVSASTEQRSGQLGTLAPVDEPSTGVLIAKGLGRHESGLHAGKSDGGDGLIQGGAQAR